MNIARFMKEHESFVKQQLLADESDCRWNEVKKLHTRNIGYMQHERLIHLLVTLAFGGFLLLSIVMALVKPLPQVIVLAGLFGIMLVAYVVHYFFLENTVQRWYQLMDEIERRAASSVR